MKAVAKRAASERTNTSGHSTPRHQPDLRVNKAQTAWDERRYDEAIWYYERALARDPHNPVLLIDVARAYALRYRFADAEKLVDLANSLHPNDANLQQMLGHSYLQIQQFDRAIACFRRSLELAPDRLAGRRFCWSWPRCTSGCTIWRTPENVPRKCSRSRRISTRRNTCWRISIAAPAT